MDIQPSQERSSEIWGRDKKTRRREMKTHQTKKEAMDGRLHLRPAEDDDGQEVAQQTQEADDVE